MKQPNLPNAAPRTPSPPPPLSPVDAAAAATNSNNNSKRKKPPTPEEMVSSYEAKGLDYKQASLKVIRELQTVLYQAALPGRRKKDKFIAEADRKLDNINSRLISVETKLDAKPGFSEALAIGFAAGAGAPVMLGGFGQIWNAVRSATENHPHS